MTRHQKLTAAAMALLALLFAGSVASSALAQQLSRRKTLQKEETYTRPKPTKPIKPMIPAENRYRSDKVFLENADSLFRIQSWNDTTERQIVSGNVKFRQGSMWMYCDSAYYYPQINSMDAFGHVRMEQGDTLFVFADQLFYNGDARLAKLTNGPSEPKVRLKDPSGELLTDTLDYDVELETGFYGCGGLLKDDVNTLTSRFGQYNSRTKDAEFFYDVELVNHKDNFTLLSDTLYYNTSTHLAVIDSPTDILGPADTIRASRGWYDTRLGNLEMTNRAMIIHTDSLGRATTLEGDSIVYDNATRISRAYRYRDIAKLGQPTVITDTANKLILISGYGAYNDSTKEAFATDYPLLKEYSRPDTLFLRADSIFTFILPDTVRQRAVHPALKEDTFEYAEWPFEPDSVLFPPVGREEMRRWLISVFPQDEMEVKEIREVHAAKAYPRARFFNEQAQGVADTLEFYEKDSLMFMKRKPVVWSGERQVNGKEIILHFNDSTVDHALLPQSGFMAEHVDEDYYNQLAGRKMEAWFEDNYLKRLYVEGNVQAIMLPMENDSTFNKLVDAESSYMTVDMKDRQMERLKMWPEVTGNTTPLFLVRRAQKYLPQFKWLEAIRPKRITTDGRSRWADELGEVPEELEIYFETD